MTTVTTPIALMSLRPGAEWTMTDDDISTIIWHTPNVEPVTQADIDAEITRLEQEDAAAAASKEAARLSARARLSGMGFTGAEIDAMYPNLAAPVEVQPLT